MRAKRAREGLIWFMLAFTGACSLRSRISLQKNRKRTCERSEPRGPDLVYAGFHWRLLAARAHLASEK